MNDAAAAKYAGNLGTDELAALYGTMRLIRSVEERMGEFQKAGELPGPVHLCIGQEAIPTGICAHLGDADYIASTHRGHGHFLAKGGDPASMMAEVFGRVDGICKGKGGSMHVADFSKGIMGANGIVAGGVSLATGAALAAQLDGKGRVSVVFFGDGASTQGVIAEAFNLASLWKLPMLFICENNGFSEFSPYATVNAGEIADRAKPYKIPSEVIDGNDVIAVWQAAKVAVSRARDGQGPTLIEAKTYRQRGHVEYEETFLTRTYRSADEVALWKQADPLIRFRSYLLKNGLVDETALTDIDVRTAKKVDHASEFAKASEWPSESIAFEDMLS